ncbi:MAG: hypothetical protein ACYDEP_12645 [Acidimicrobiales bacterium]
MPVHVQMSPGTRRSVALKGGPGPIELVVRAHSFQVGPALPMAGWFTYYSDGPGSTMRVADTRSGLFRPGQSILLSLTPSDGAKEIAISGRGDLREIWDALERAGVKGLTEPPPSSSTEVGTEGVQ